MSSKSPVGFIGVGLMGHGAAKNILERGGYPLTVLGHRNRAPVDDLVALGAREARSLSELAGESDVVITCLPSSVEVEAAFRGEEGLLAAARPDMIFIDATTNDPAVTRTIGEALRSRNAHFVDAALGRTPKEAEEGRLSTYIGGDASVIERIRPILESYCDTIVVCGPLGAGTTCKLVNNSITIGTVALFAEGFATAAKLGVDLSALSDVLSAGGANGRMWQMIEPWIRSGDDSHLKGPLRIAAKDLRTYGRMAEGAGVAVFIAQAVNQTLRLALNQGHADRFLPVLPGILAELNGGKIRDLD
ncbi:MAG: NAD(P)-dependent oxidoreductase [Rhizobiales bacterium]|nr:NAD(P)-dependent oxidoreductase [Hyphomicrobiales bacterium]